MPCQVSELLEECGKKTVAMIRDVKCGGRPLPVCRKHKREFLDKKMNGHYALVRSLLPKRKAKKVK